ncbi:MAG: glycerophosphodiester phosphodiesterase [bacterium]|nr:glycerophosphodiester phosphodiesterase [bacterium]
MTSNVLHTRFFRSGARACRVLALAGVGLVAVAGCSESVTPMPSLARTLPPELPARGVSAHRGASQSHPENTLAAIRAAVEAGAQQIEIDLRSTADGELVLMHDKRVDRSTDGRGEVAELAFEQLRELDAGEWHDARFAGERIPTLAEALDAIPRDRWINLDVKGGAELARRAVRVVADRGELDRVIFATRRDAPEAVRHFAREAWICDMDRGTSRRAYIENAAARGADFVQLHSRRGLPDIEEVARAHELGLRVNYCCTENARQVAAALRSGIDFPLSDDAPATLADAEVREALSLGTLPPVVAQ